MTQRSGVRLRPSRTRPYPSGKASVGWKMIFRILRLFLKDNELIDAKAQIRQARDLLAEYENALKSVHSSRGDDTILEQDRVDPEFLGLLWVVIVFVMTAGGWAGARLLSRFPDILQSFASNEFSAANLLDIGCAVLNLGALAFVIVNGAFGLRLLRLYAQTKTDRGYHSFVESISWLIIVVLVFNVIFAISLVVAISAR
jgi:hypothetical protein